MQPNANFIDPWMQTIGLLSLLSGVSGASGRRAEASEGRPTTCRPQVAAQLQGVQVRLIDRPSRSTATIEWRDPTHCCYGDQVWRTSRARVAGVCAMSKRPIRPGDAIYKPRSCRPMPINSDAMILRSVLEEAPTL
ncbi:hypothetical protein AWB81_07986 [Caballeronia arationis]|jgi:hypothetical protein|uniref:Ribosomal protein S14 n=1 Tax=Caballeronia arationis TaxID=1777142 RepID=A0A7Z7I405_9BURK|nr:DUF3331 domain-containing protein [Caballeronia arationis]SAL07255.1 hypothetical protein AWB81_07986 [Caballeronia arationis]SOE57754.1 protein of unknown function [Caballeronia arationis]